MQEKIHTNHKIKITPHPPRKKEFGYLFKKYRRTKMQTSSLKPKEVRSPEDIQNEIK
jgi:hypothetical protein